MDATAFEEDVDVAFEDLVPNAMRKPLQHAACILSRLAGILLLMISIFGCSVAFVVMLVWIMQYWMLTRLFLATATLLRTVYDQSEQEKLTANENAGGSPRLKPDEDSKGRKSAITAADLDAFESYLGTTGTPSTQRTGAIVNGSSHDLRHAAQQQDPSQESQDRDEAERRILLQEKELDAQIQAISTASMGKQQQDASPDRLTAGKEATSSKDKNARPGRGLKDPCYYYQLGKCKSDANGADCPFAHVHDPTFVAKPCHYFQMGCCEAGEDCTYRHVKDPNFVRQPRQADFNSDNDGTQHPRSNQNKYGFTAEQMADAVSFASAATRGRSSGKSTVKTTVKVQQNPMVHRVDRSGDTPSAAKNAVRAVDPNRPTVWNFKSTVSPDTLPPHLKKLYNANAAKSSESRLSTTQKITPPNSANNRSASAKSKDSISAYGRWESGATNVPLKRSGFEQILQTDDSASSQHVAEQNEGGQQLGRLKPENVPSSAMTIDSLKALDPRQQAKQRRPRLPGSFLAGIEKGIRIIAGKEEGLRRTEREPADLDKDYGRTAPQQSTVSVTSINKSPVHEQIGTHDKLEPSGEFLHGQARNENLDSTSHIASDDGDKEESEQSNGGEFDQIQSHYLPRGNPHEEPDSNTRNSPPVTLAHQMSHHQTASPEPQEKTDLFKQMADLFNKGMEKKAKAVPAATNEDQPPRTDFAPDITTHRSGGYELDLVGLDFSVGTTFPEKRPVVTSSKETTTPQLRASSLEFAPNAAGREREAKTLAAATSASKGAEQAAAVSARLLPPASSSGIQSAASMPPVPLYVPHADTHPGSAFCFPPVIDHSYNMSVPSSHYYTPFDSPSHAPVGYLHQPEPYMGYPDTGYGLAAHVSPFDYPFSQPSQYFPPTPPASVPARAGTASKAVAIRKPPELRYMEEFPQLPSSKPSPARAKVQPPPGFSGDGSHSPQTTFDALLSQPSQAASSAECLTEKGPNVATSNPFDAILHTSNEVQQIAQIANNADPQDERAAHAGTEKDTTSKATQKKRKQVRADLAAAWLAREAIRKRVSSCWTLDGARALEEASKLYNARRDQLRSLTASGELREGDFKMFPYLPTSDLKVPQASASSVRKLIPDEKADLSSTTASNTGVTDGVKKVTKAQKRSDEEKAELYKKAIDARNVYAEAHAFFTRPPPPGIKKIKDLKAQGEARIERARKYYNTKVQELNSAYGGTLLADVKEKLWTYDDEALKKSRNF